MVDERGGTVRIGAEGKSAARAWWMLNPVGSLIGFALAVLSVMPSLVPRTAVMQGAVAAIVFAVGYLIGFMLMKLWHRVARWRIRDWRTIRLLWAVYGLLWVVALVVLAERAVAWQNEVRRLVEMPPLSGVELGGFALGFLPVVVVLLLIGRGVQGLYRGMRRTVGSAMSAGGTILVGVAASTALLLVVLGAIDGIYAARNGSPDAQTAEPASAFRSAGAASSIRWQDLGRHGSLFVGGGPDAEQITALTGIRAQEPIRIYAGMASAESLEERARLAVAELHRTGAFDREVLVVATTTGSGWLEPQTVDALEYLMAGDTAIVAMQYAYTPSWVSSVFDPELPTAAARILFDAVFGAWQQLPVSERPLLLSYGLSLGAYGSQGVFDDLDDLRGRTDGALFVGSPNGAELWRTLQERRDADSPVWLPVLDNGSEVRWMSRAGDEDRLAGPWEAPRVLYLQHATDAVTWLTPALIWQKPEWLAPERASDVSAQMRWMPVITALQVTVDMLGGEAVPARHGHNFGDVVLTGWREVIGHSPLDAEAFSRVQAEIESYAPIPAYEP